MKSDVSSLNRQKWQARREIISVIFTAALVFTTFWYAWETYRLREQVGNQTLQAARQSEMMSKSVEQQIKQTEEISGQRKLLEQQLSLASTEHWNSVSPLLLPQFATWEQAIQAEGIFHSLTAVQLKDLQRLKGKPVESYLFDTYGRYWVALSNRVPRIALDVSVVIHDVDAKSFWVADHQIPTADDSGWIFLDPTGKWLEKEDALAAMSETHGGLKDTLEYLLRDPAKSYIVVLYRNLEGVSFGVRREFFVTQDGVVGYLTASRPQCLTCPPPE
jgi:hypothetical protein